jgi:hypothetical protein
LAIPQCEVQVLHCVVSGGFVFQIACVLGWQLFSKNKAITLLNESSL